VRDIADATTSMETILALGVETKDRVEELVDQALASGGRPANDTDDQGFMYERSFQDPDGHIWEVLYMDPTAVQEQA